MRRAGLERNPTFVPVVAAAIWGDANHLLLQQGLPHKRHAGLWEFPGGKVETHETPRFALCREVAEELNLELAMDALEPAGFAEEPGQDHWPHLVLFLYNCRVWRGEPRALEGQRWGWFSPAQAATLPMPLMDRALLTALTSGAAPFAN